MLTADININEFNRGLARYQNQLGLDARKVMRTELGQLVKTLVRISPPSDRNKSMRMMKAKVNKRFEKLKTRDSGFLNSSIKASKSGLKLYAASSKYLFAGAADADMTNATTQELRKVFYATRKLQGATRIIAGFKKPRPSGQKVAISTKVLTKEKQVEALGKRIAKNFGRLKAGWLAPLKRGAITAGGKFAVPNWVRTHMPGLRGDFLDHIRNPNNPSFIIINRAKGITGKQSKYFVNQALKIRGKAMAANAKLILSGKKDYQYS
jgi:hypothetical protein